MKVKILCAVSGGGKTTYIKNNFPGAEVCSADHLFERWKVLGTEEGEVYERVLVSYDFDPKRLGEAHAECLQKFVHFVACKGESLEDLVVVVDNTNTTVVELAPYAALALAYGHELEIIIIEADPAKAHARNTHGVPLGTVMAQHNRLVKLAEQLPPWWPVKKVSAEF